jgi:hypothetical protein
MRIQKGQSTVELALILTVIVLVFAIAADLARVFHAALIVANSSREAAEFAATQATAPPTAAAVRNVAVRHGAPFVTSTNVLLEPWDSTGAPPAPGEPLKVTVEATFTGLISPVRSIPLRFVTRLRRNCPMVNGKADCPIAAPIP